MTKKKSGFLSTLSNLINEPEPGDKTEDVVSEEETSAPAPITNSRSTPAVVTLAYTAPGVIDPTTMEEVKSRVFNITDSKYVKFSTLMSSMGNNVNTVITAMSVMDSSVSAQSISSEITTLLNNLSSTEKAANTDLDQLKNQTMSEIDAKLAILAKANEDAAAEMARHQKETGERINEMTALQQQRASEEAKIGSTKNNVMAAVNQIRTELTAAQSVLNSTK